MERIAIISDVHGNLTALNTVLKDISDRNIHKIFCLGDSILKCPNPDKVIDILREKCEVIIKGNCDHVVCRPNVAPNRFWTRDKIGEERAAFIYNSPVYYDFYLSGHLIRLFHASPFSLEHVYNPMYSNDSSQYSNSIINNPNDLFKNTPFIGKTEDDPIPDIVGYGHLHTPLIVRQGNKTIFNPGSVGVPIEMSNNDSLDETNKFSTLASYIILEGEYDSKELSSISFNLIRLPYNIDEEINNLLESDMPGKESIIEDLKSACPRR